jgi:S1-C subfamily serine protease
MNFGCTPLGGTMSKREPQIILKTDERTDKAKAVEITTDDGKTYDAKVIGSDPRTDLARIKVDGRSDFPYVKFAEHRRLGGCGGNPFGLGGTVTAGIVSARGRDIGSGPYDDYIQIDAPVNKGNSGGPTFDMEGNVVGVNTRVAGDGSGLHHVAPRFCGVTLDLYFLRHQSNMPPMRPPVSNAFFCFSSRLS